MSLPLPLARIIELRSKLCVVLKVNRPLLGARLLTNPE